MSHVTQSPAPTLIIEVVAPGSIAAVEITAPVVQLTVAPGADDVAPAVIEVVDVPSP